jgi:ABC-type lipoprotein release transport system permease subunit
MFSGPVRPAGGYMKGIPGPASGYVPEVLRNLKAGQFTGWDPVRGMPPIVMGSKLARETGMTVGAVVRVLSPQHAARDVGRRRSECGRTAPG